MTRTTATDVAEIYETDLDTSSISAHIDAATELVNDIEEAGDLDSQRLSVIETYVAAHLVSLQDPRVERESVGSGDWVYDTDTTYLQMAIQLDTTDTLDPNADEPANIHVPDGRGIE